jgi:hypothetical protein
VGLAGYRARSLRPPAAPFRQVDDKHIETGHIVDVREAEFISNRSAEGQPVDDCEGLEAWRALSSTYFGLDF